MIRKLWLKSCTRCYGDMVVEQDQWGHYRVCIQCGHSQELPKAERQPKPALAGKAA